MKRLLPLLAAVLALAASSTASADTFRVERPHASRPSSAAVSGGPAVAFTQRQNGPMPFAALQAVWQAAGNAYGIPWQVLGAINKVETNFGRNLGPSSAGAVGWMQFMPSTWARWGIDANGDGVADPNNPTDAIFSAARYLVGCGGQFDIAKAVYCYNHSQAYVSEVLGLAAVFGHGGGSFAGGSIFSVDLQPQLDSVRKQIAGAKTGLAAARAQAGRLAHAEHRFLRAAATAPLLSDQLAARKRAVLLGVRRYSAEARARRLQRSLDTAKTRLDRLQEQASSPTFIPGSLALGTGDNSGVTSIALQYLGVPYVWAGATPRGFDCSGLVQYVFGQLGIPLPHNAAAQWHDPAAVSVPQDQLQPGDLVFFNKLDHVGIYIGSGYFVDAPHTGATVRIDSLSEGWYAANYDGAKRIVAGSLGNSSVGVGAMTFTSGGGTNFTSDVVYFTR
jgi:cell wall-associated NlpC family hydrolase